MSRDKVRNAKRALVRQAHLVHVRMGGRWLCLASLDLRSAVRVIRGDVRVQSVRFSGEMGARGDR